MFLTLTKRLFHQPPAPSFIHFSHQRAISTFSTITMADVGSKANGAVLGVITADAGAVPLHWIYDPNKLAEYIKTESEKNKGDFAFIEKGYTWFYTIKTGMNSAYGDTILCVMRSMLRSKGELNIQDWKLSVCETFGEYNKPESSLYQRAKELRGQLNSLRDSYKKILTEQKIDLGDEYRDSRLPSFITCGPWIPHTVDTLLENMSKDGKDKNNAMKDTNDSDAFNIAIPYIAKLAIKAVKDNKVEFPKDAVKSFMNEAIGKEQTVAYSLVDAEWLWYVLTGCGDCKGGKACGFQKWAKEKADKLSKSDKDSVEFNVGKEMNVVLDKFEKDFKEEKDCNLKTAGEKYIANVAEFGKACPHPGNFKNTMYNLLIFERIKEDDFKSAMLREISGGGDCCGRICTSGALIGAMVGADGIPKEWMEKVAHLKVVQDFTKNVLG